MVLGIVFERIFKCMNKNFLKHKFDISIMQLCLVNIKDKINKYLNIYDIFILKIN
jgi:hypothetical protein